MLYILGVSCAFSIIFIIIMIAVCIKWCNSWWMVFLPLLGQPYGMCAYRVCVSGFVESNKMHLCATSAGSCLCGVHSHLAPWKYHVSLPNKLSVKWKELMFLSAIYILMTPSPLHLEPPEVSRSWIVQSSSSGTVPPSHPKPPHLGGKALHLSTGWPYRQQLGSKSSFHLIFFTWHWEEAAWITAVLGTL